MYIYIYNCDFKLSFKTFFLQKTQLIVQLKKGNFSAMEFKLEKTKFFSSRIDGLGYGLFQGLKFLVWVFQRCFRKNNEYIFITVIMIIKN